MTRARTESVLTAVPLVVALAALVLHALVAVPFDVAALDLEREANVATALSSGSFLLAAALAVAAAARGAAPVAGWGVVAAFCAAAGLDEALAGHEEVGTAVGRSATLALVQPAAAAVVALLLLAVALLSREVPAWWLRLAAASVLASQVLASAAGLLVLRGPLRTGTEGVGEFLEVWAAASLAVAAAVAAGVRADLRPPWSRATRPAVVVAR